MPSSFVEDPLRAFQHRRLGRPIPLDGGGTDVRDGGVQRLPHAEPVDAAADGIGDQRGGLDALDGVVRHDAGAARRGVQFWRARIGDADRGRTHRPSVGGAEAAGDLRGYAVAQCLQRGFRRRAEQIQRPLGLHRRLPCDQVVGVPVDIQITVIGDQTSGQQHRLFGVVGDAAGLHAGRDRLPVHRIPEPRDGPAVGLLDLIGRHALRRHAQRIAACQTVQRAQCR